MLVLPDEQPEMPNNVIVAVRTRHPIKPMGLFLNASKLTAKSGVRPSPAKTTLRAEEFEAIAWVVETVTTKFAEFPELIGRAVGAMVQVAYCGAPVQVRFAAREKPGPPARARL